MKLELLTKITDRSASVGIIGMGYVGLPLAIRFSEEQFKVVGFDIDVKKVSILNAGNSFIKHIEKEKISAMVESGFIATEDFGKISNIDEYYWSTGSSLLEYKNNGLFCDYNLTDNNGNTALLLASEHINIKVFNILFKHV